jgi:carboxypeptidase T
LTPDSEESSKQFQYLSFGGKTFTAAQIQAIVNGLDIFVFPQANPDGRNYSMNSDVMWRKNRRPEQPDHPGCIGVDVNRNYEFLWNYPAYFSQTAGVANSTDPCDYQVYIGPGAVSEPETKNVVWLMDNNPSIRFFIDLHSFGEDILYSWGDAPDQTTDPNMNFHNSEYNGVRGGASYQEFIPANDQLSTVALGKSIATAIKGVCGREYTVEQSISLYPTAGTSDDYSFSRHFIDSSKGKIIAYTVEWGSPANPTPFHPPYTEMENIIKEATAGLVQFCVEVLAQ